MAVLEKLDLTGNVAVVTGAGRGLGRAISLSLADAGAELVLTARTQSQIEETAELVRAKGRGALSVTCDVTDSTDVRSMIEATLVQYGRVDVLVNNAGGATPGMQNTLVDIDDNHWRVGVDTNLTGAMYCTRAAIPQMLKQGSGKIINVTSGFGLRVARDNFIYTSAKAGLINFTRALALTYAPNIQANLIAPGLFPHDNAQMIEWWRGGKFVPMGRLGGDDEIGNLAVVLASGLTSYMNGQIIVLDGGGLAGGHAPTGFAPLVPLAAGVVNEQFALEGKRALVIGASNTIGRAIAVALGEAGADVAVATTTRAKDEETIANSCSNELWALDRKTFAQAIDAADEEEVASLIQRTISELGGLDILVNAHDLPFAKPAVDVTTEEWRRVVEVNLGGPFVACRAAAKHMLIGEGGSIINVASVLGERGLANGAVYCAAQAGVLNLTRALALEWARSGIRVNAIGAGWTEGMGIIGDDESRAKLEHYLPYKRLAKPDEVAGLGVYLAGDASAYLTGQVVWVDGGALSHV